jgi:hypothetical protein
MDLRTLADLVQQAAEDHKGRTVAHTIFIAAALLRRWADDADRKGLPAWQVEV